MASDTVLADLDKLIAEADPEPWTLIDPPPAPSHSDHGWRVVAEFTGRQGPKRLYIPREAALAPGGWNSEANAALTVHAHNHLRRQVAALDKVHGEVLRVLGGNGINEHARISLMIAHDTAKEALDALGHDIAKLREVAN